MVTLSTNLNIKLFTNKNSKIFEESLKNSKKIINSSGNYGILYDDYDPNIEISDKWIKENKNINIFTISKRSKTLAMDSKISFCKRMRESKYTPESYLCIDEITHSAKKSDTELYFIKNDYSTGSKGVNVYKYNDLQKINVKNCVIQKNMCYPDLFNNKRYKIRVLVGLNNNKVYYNKKSWASISQIEYNINENDLNILRDMNIIYQTANRDFILTSELEDFETINNNIILALKDFKIFYEKEIKNISKNEFVILGFDFVVDREKNVHIIEINHRPNFCHPKHISDNTDIPSIADFFKILIDNDYSNTDYITIE